VTAQGSGPEEVEEEEKDSDDEEKKELEKKKAIGRKWRKVRKGNKWWMEFADGMHNTTCTTRDYWQEVATFVDQFS